MYLQMIICRGHKNNLLLQVRDSLLQLSPRFCSIGDIKVGLGNLYAEEFVFSSQSRFGTFAVYQ